jgi:hypothetical protein
MNGTLRDDLGVELDAAASLTQTGKRYQLTFESSGESGRRNSDYTRAFELAMERLALLGAVLQDGRVESRTTRDWAAPQKRLYVDYAYPISLSRIVDIATFARDLRAAGAKVGRKTTHGGNPTKRITLELTFPTAFAGGLEGAYQAVFGMTPAAAVAASTNEEAKLHTWWNSKRKEHCWLEITDREDIGTDLRAPITDDRGKDFWSYNLLRRIRAGDIVYHFAPKEAAIVAVSRATATQWADAITWPARGRSAPGVAGQPHARSGWYVGLERFTLLSSPVSLEHIRNARAQIQTAVQALTRDVGDPLYFPFELDSSRELQPVKGYLFKLPQFFVKLFPSLSIKRLESELSSTQQPLVPGPYRRADEQSSVSASDPFSIDPALRERALRSHSTTQNALADFLKNKGLTPYSPLGNQPNFDIAWENGSTLWVAEVKSLNDDNEEKQLRLGLGQVLRYRHLAGRTRTARAALVTERKPRDDSWQHLCAELGVVLAWPGNWRALGKLEN